MRAYLESFRLVLRSGYTVLAGILGVIGIAGFFVSLPRVPVGIALGLALAALWVGAFKAFHTIRLWQADVLRPAPGSRPQANRLAWTSRVEGFAPPLTSPPSTGFVIRLAISDDRPATPGDITSDTIDHLSAILGSPAIVRLLAFAGTEPADPEPGEWTLNQQSTWMVEFRRPERRSRRSGTVLSARCLLQKPIGNPNFPAGPSPLLLLDIVATDDGDAERLTLSLAKLMEVVTDGMDVAANQLSALLPPLVYPGRRGLLVRLRRPVHLVGPNVAICGIGRTLQTVVELGQLERAPEGRDFQSASFDTPFGCDVRDSTKRDIVIRGAIVTMLRDNGYLRSEAVVSHLFDGSGSQG